jgi:hypothetical protein
MITWQIGGVVGATLVLTMTAGAQDLMQRAEQVRDGQVRFSVTLRPGVCGHGQNIWRTGKGDGRRSWMGGKGEGDLDYDIECETGPGRVIVDKVDGRVQDVRFYVGGRWKARRDATDLGQVASRDAERLLLQVVRNGNGRAAEHAIWPLTVIDSVEPWPELLRVARDDGRPNQVRKQAVFWLGQAAGDPATAGLKEIVGDAALDRDVREQAIFALSQQPKDKGVPALINVVRTNKDPELRRKALFWLGQSGDPRAVNLIEELLTRR